jgi:ribosomal protein S27E
MIEFEEKERCPDCGEIAVEWQHSMRICENCGEVIGR